MGAGPIKRLLQIDGVLDGSLYGVSGSNLYKGSVSLGAIDGTGPVSMAGFSNRLFANAGASLWEYNGTTLSTVTTPGGLQVLSICEGTDRLIIIDKGTGHFYWSDVLSDNIQALSFATAENSPDNLKECLFIGDTLFLFGSETVEWWPANSSNSSLPWQPLVGKTFQVGIRDTGCACEFSTTLAWITNHNQVCIGDPQTIVSTPALDERIAKSTAASLWKFYLDGTAFLAVSLDTETWVFSQKSSQWSTFASDGQVNWIPQCYAENVFGSRYDGRVLAWSNTYDDFGGVMERLFTAGLPIVTASVPLNNITLKCNPGQTPYLSGNYVEPTVELRSSKDGGFTWGPWKQRSLGVNGEYRKTVRWYSLGYFSNPGILVQVRVDDPVPFRVSGMHFNESYASV